MSSSPAPHDAQHLVAFDACVAAALAQAELGSYQDSIALLNEALQLCPPEDNASRARVLAELANNYPRLGDLQASVRCASQAVALVEAMAAPVDTAVTGAPSVLADALTSLAYVYAQLLMGRDALECSLRALAVARQGGDPVGEAWALNRVGVAYGSLDNPTQACETTRQALHIAQRLDISTAPSKAEAARMRQLHFSCLNNLAYFWLNRMGEAARRGDASQLRQAQDEALRLAAEATSMARLSNSQFKVAVAVSNLVEALLGRADYVAAASLLAEFEHLSRSNGYVALGLQAATQRALMLKAQGDFVGATAGLRDLLAPPAPTSSSASSSELPPKLRRILIRALYETHKANAEFREALGYLEQLTELERQITRDTMALQTEVMLIRQEMAQARTHAAHAQLDAQRERERARQLEREQQRLHEQAAALDRAAHEDVLTGLHNRRHAEFALPLLVEGARQSSQLISLGVLDVDHFKRVNDDFGHAVGDLVLQQLAQLLRKSMRSADLLARVGGEEFLVVLVGMGPAQSQLICERLRAAVAEHPWHLINLGLVVHISMGLAGGEPPAEAQTLMVQADQALYAAKRAGRNRVCLADYKLATEAR